MGMVKDFKNFIMTGNVVEFAVAVIMAGAMALVINGFVNDIAMPVVGELAGGTDFSQMKVVLSETVADDGTVAVNSINYGSWINSIINLLIVGLVMFLIVRVYSKTKTPPPPPAPKGPTTEELLAEIRDSLKK